MDDHHKPRISGLHHLKIAVSNLQDSLDWYAKVFGAIRRPEYDHVDRGGNLFAVLVAIPGLDTMIEFRLAPRIAAGLRGFDPIVFSTELRDDLVRWQSHLDALGIENSGLIYGIVGWTLIWRDQTACPFASTAKRNTNWTWSTRTLATPGCVTRTLDPVTRRDDSAFSLEPRVQDSFTTGLMSRRRAKLNAMRSKRRPQNRRLARAGRHRSSSLWPQGGSDRDAACRRTLVVVS